MYSTSLFDITHIYLTTVVRSPEGVETSQGVRDEAIRLILRYEALCKESNVSDKQNERRGRGNERGDGGRGKK